jgi:DNA-binding MarR family transcriptional regulator
MDHDLNVIGALTVVLGDRIRDATEEASGMRGALPAALSSLHEWAGGRTIETLAGGLRLSHSRTVRVVDRLEQRGLARRAPDPSDGRGVLVHLTPAGERAARRVLEARAAALEQAVAGEERAELARIAERLLAGATTGRRSAGAICRLCDGHACGHHEGRCPVTRAADAAEAARR